MQVDTIEHQDSACYGVNRRLLSIMVSVVAVKAIWAIRDKNLTGIVATKIVACLVVKFFLKG